MGLGNSENDVIVDDGDGGGGGGGLNGKSFGGSVSCSICLEVVADNGDRSLAKLQCGHQFHLDCIGSAFNVKGAMQCPNCRKIEKGQWLYANGCRSLPEFSVDDWAHDEDLYDLSYSEMAHGCTSIVSDMQLLTYLVLNGFTVLWGSLVSIWQPSTTSFIL